MNNKTLVTGAPGWLGTRLVEALTGKAPELTAFSSRGARPVRALVLPGFNSAPLNSFGAEIVRGDVTNPSTLTDALRGVDTVFHCVGLIHPKKISQLFEINTRGTENLVAAAKLRE